MLTLPRSPDLTAPRLCSNLRRFAVDAPEPLLHRTRQRYHTAERARALALLRSKPALRIQSPDPGKLLSPRALPKPAGAESPRPQRARLRQRNRPASDRGL